MIPLTPLDDWLAQRLGFAPEPEPLWNWQARMIRRTMDFAARNSPFYARRLAGLSPDMVARPGDMGLVPFTNPGEIGSGDDFLCLSRGDIARVVTLHTSGTTGQGKRVHFTVPDLEATIDFFHHGMSTFAGPGSRVLILLPTERPDSVGDLLARGLTRLGAEPVCHGLPTNPGDAMAALVDNRADCVVGFPVHILTMARGCAHSCRARGLVKSVLFCSDNVPRAIRDAVEAAWDCASFAHWGMTETGLGGGVECRAGRGYHLREADLYVEVVDSESGLPLPFGRIGEVVVTTLARRGMPLIRYRTGDLAALETGPCPCGSLLKRLGPITGRVDGARPLGRGTLSMADLDECLFAVPEVLDFKAELSGGAMRFVLRLGILAVAGCGEAAMGSAGERVRAMLADRGAAGVELEMGIVDGPPAPHGAKRVLLDKRQMER